MDTTTGLTRERAAGAMALGLAGGLGLWWLASSNFAAIPFATRLAAGIAVLVGSSLVGFKALGTPGQSVAGEAWLVLAAFAQLGVGATLAQAFQLGGDGWELWAAWAAGAGAMAWATRSGALGLVAAFALLGTGCTLPAELGWTIPWAWALGLVPLAYRADSHLLLRVALVGTGLGLLAQARGEGSSFALAALATVGWLAWDVWHHARLPAHVARRALTTRDPRPFDDDVRAFADGPLGAAMVGGIALFVATLTAVSDGQATLGIVFGVSEELTTVPATDRAALATVGAATLAAIAGWAWADGRTPGRALHRAVGLAAGATLLIASGAVDALAGEALRPWFGMTALVALGVSAAREGDRRGQEGWAALWLGAVVLLMLGVLLNEDSGEAARATSLVLFVGGVVLARWRSSRRGAERPGGELAKKGADA